MSRLSVRYRGSSLQEQGASIEVMVLRRRVGGRFVTALVLRFASSVVYAPLWKNPLRRDNKIHMMNPKGGQSPAFGIERI